MARIALINPRFPTSFWGLNHGLPLLGQAVEHAGAGAAGPGRA